MKKLLTILALGLIACSTHAQIYLPIKTWYQYDRIRVQDVLIFPSDTVKTKEAGATCWINGQLWSANGTYWKVISGSGGPGNVSVVTDTSNGVITPTMKNTWDASVNGFGAINRIPKFSATKTLTNSLLFDDGAKITSSGLIEYNTDYSALYGPRSLVDKGAMDLAISGITNGGTSELQNMTLATMYASTSLSTTKTYFITDTLRQGLYRFKTTVANTLLDDQGHYLVNAGKQLFERMNFDGKINVAWFLRGTYIAPTVANSSVDTAVGSGWENAWNSAIVAAGAWGQTIYMNDEGVLHGNIDTLDDRVARIDFNGKLHTNKRGFLKMAPPHVAGSDKGLAVYGKGQLVGQENVPVHTKATHDAGTGPNWAAMTWNAFEVYNTPKNFIQTFKITGFKSLLECINGGGAAPGTQELTLQCSWMDRVAHGLIITSTTGSTWADKIRFSGVDGGVFRFDGGLFLKCTGGPGQTGESGMNKIINGNFERVDSMVDIQGHMIDLGWESCTFEMGLQTGLFCDPSKAFVVRNTGSPFSGPSGMHFNDCGFFYIDILQNGIGAGGSITHSRMFIRDYPSGQNAVYVGSNAIATLGGKIIITDAPENLSLANRNRAPANFSFRQSMAFLDDDTTLTSSYTLTAGHKIYKVNSASSVTLTLPSASTMMKKPYIIQNIGSGTVTIANLAYGSNTVNPGTGASLTNDASNWMRPDNGNSSGSAGSGSAADSTHSGYVTTGDQKFGGGKQVDSLSTDVISMYDYRFPSSGKLDITRRQNGLSFFDNGTPNPTSSTLTAYNFGSGNSAKNTVFGVGKTNVRWMGFGNNGSDFLLITETNSNGFIFRNAVGYSALDIGTSSFTGTNLMQIFPSGNVLVQTGGNYIDSGYKVDIKGSLRTLGNGVFRSAISVGTAPSTFYALMHLGSSATGRALFEIDPLSSYSTSPRPNTIDYNGAHLRLTDNNGTSSILLKANPNVTGASTDDPVVSDGAGATTTRRPPYQLIYSVPSTTNISGSNHSSTTILSGGAQTLTGANLGIGDRLVITCEGAINAPATPTTGQVAIVTLTINGYSQTFTTALDGATYNSNISPNTKPYKFIFTVTPTATGTSSSARLGVDFTVFKELSPDMAKTHWYNIPISSINTVNPTINVSVTWASATTSASSMDVYQNSIEIFRQ